MTDPTYPLFPIFAFLGFILPLIPLPWQLEAWNTGTVYFILWSSLASLNLFINSIIWAGNVKDVAPIWCEISIRILFGASVGVPAASFCINRRLYSIAKVRTVAYSSSEKRRAVLIDTLICVLFPMVFIALQYIVQGHRYNIFEDMGCRPALFNSLPLYFLNFMWPLVIGLGSAIYAVMTLIAFAQRRLEFSRFMATNKTLTMSRYLRLMALSMTELLLTVPLSIYVIWLDSTAMPLDKWVSMEDTHFNYSRVEQFPRILYTANAKYTMSLEFTRWIVVVCSFIIFGYFGFAEEARRHYKQAFWSIAKRFGYHPAPPASKKGLPLYVKAPSSLEKGLSVNASLATPPPAYMTLPSPTTPSSPSPPPTLPTIPKVARDSYLGAGLERTISLSEYSAARVSMYHPSNSSSIYAMPSTPCTPSEWSAGSSGESTARTVFTDDDDGRHLLPDSPREQYLSRPSSCERPSQHGYGEPRVL